MQRQIIECDLLDRKLESRCARNPQPGMREFSFDFAVMPLRRSDIAGCNWEVVFAKTPGSFQREIDDIIPDVRNIFNISRRDDSAAVSEHQTTAQTKQIP